MAKKLNDEGGGQNTIKPDEFLGLVSELETAQRAIDEATGVKRAIHKRAKSMGASLDAIAMLLRLRLRRTKVPPATPRPSSDRGQLSCPACRFRLGRST